LKVEIHIESKNSSLKLACAYLLIKYSSTLLLYSSLRTYLSIHTFCYYLFLLFWYFRYSFFSRMNLYSWKNGNEATNIDENMYTWGKVQVKYPISSFYVYIKITWIQNGMWSGYNAFFISFNLKLSQRQKLTRILYNVEFILSQWLRMNHDVKSSKKNISRGRFLGYPYLPHSSMP